MRTPRCLSLLPLVPTIVHLRLAGYGGTFGVSNPAFRTPGSGGLCPPTHSLYCLLQHILPCQHCGYFSRSAFSIAASAAHPQPPLDDSLFAPLSLKSSKSTLQFKASFLSRPHLQVSGGHGHWKNTRRKPTHNIPFGASFLSTIFFLSEIPAVYSPDWNPLRPLNSSLTLMTSEMPR